MIAIKNMTMPENCFFCPCLNVAACRCRAVVGASKEIGPMDLFINPEWCPLVELPDIQEPFEGATIYGYTVSELATFARLCEELGYTRQDIHDIRSDLNVFYTAVMQKLNEEMGRAIERYLLGGYNRNPEDAYREDFGKEKGNE